MTLYELSDADAEAAFMAIAGKAFWSRCACDDSVGYTCKFCRGMTLRMARDNDEGEAEEHRQREAIERYAATLKRKAVR